MTSRLGREAIRCLVLAVAVFSTLPPAHAATSLSQYGITWTFASDYPTGQFANGDYYVVAPAGLTITSISPDSAFTALASATVTISNSSPAVITQSAHGHTAGRVIRFSTTGTLPAGLQPDRDYVVIAAGLTTNTYRVAISRDGTAINTTSAGSGVHTATRGRIFHGAMVNPKAGLTAHQGFDNVMSSSYDNALNAARPNGNALSPSNPLVLPAGSSLVSSISYTPGNRRPQLTDAAVLTVLAAAPPANSFRPPYCGNDKAIIATEADIDYTKVASLTRPASTPSLATVTGYFARPWIEINTEYTGREMHPSNNQPDYGREISKRLSAGLLSLQLNYSNAEKRDLMVRLVQYGLDVYGSAVTGGFWRESGGHNQGRKMPLLLAATVLNNGAIREYGDASKRFIFQEDRQTYYVTQATVNLTNSANWDPDPRGGTPQPYTVSDIGMAEWGINAVRNPPNNDKAWTAPYRTIVGSSTLGHILTSHIMGLKGTWNWAPWYDYMDRYWEIEKNTTPGTNTPSQFERDMWVAYRNFSLSPPAATPPSITSHPASATITAGANVTFSASATGTAPLSYQWQYNGSPISGAISTSYSITGAVVGQSGNYTLVVTNSKGSATSNTAVLTVNALPPSGTSPSITTQPAGASVNQGASVSLSVAAAGTAPLTYQWLRDGANIAGATGTTYTISNAAVSQTGTYSVVVSNSFGSATSNDVSVVVIAAPPPPPAIVAPTNAAVNISVQP